ncbi:hypothetical protein AB7Z61_22375 [Providencia rettgeri]
MTTPFFPAFSFVSVATRQGSSKEGGHASRTGATADRQIASGESLCLSCAGAHSPPKEKGMIP